MEDVLMLVADADAEGATSRLLVAEVVTVTRRVVTRVSFRTFPLGTRQQDDDAGFRVEARPTVVESTRAAHHAVRGIVVMSNGNHRHTRVAVAEGTSQSRRFMHDELMTCPK